MRFMKIAIDFLDDPQPDKNWLFRTSVQCLHTAALLTACFYSQSVDSKEENAERTHSAVV